MHSALFETRQPTSRIGYASGPEIYDIDWVFQSSAIVASVSLCLGHGNSVYLAFAATALVWKNPHSNAEIMIRYPVGPMPYGNTIGSIL